jgi:hypothetical protein
MHPLAFRSRRGPLRATFSLAAAVILAPTLLGCSGVGAGSAPVLPSPSASASGSEFSIVSTLHGLTKLPHRMHWEATPSGSVNEVKEVDFLIDDQLAWVEHNAPYFYADDGNWLVTSFLEPGAHTFVTKAITPDGRTAVETVTATVEAAPQPPAAIAGRWSKTLQGGDPGVWHVTINTIGWLFDDPHGGGQNQDAAYPTPAKVEIHAAIVEPPLGVYNRGGVFCGDPIDPDGVFRYSVSKDGSKLTLAADAPVCYQDVVQGTWKREP